jgi:uncharacterized membrane protein
VVALRLVYVLALAVWLGGMAILGAVVAPTLFQTLPAADAESGRALAGLAFGTMLARFHYVAYACGLLLLVMLVVIALLGPRPKHFAIRCGIVTGMLLVAAYSGVVVLGEIEAIQREVGTLPSRLPEGDPRRVRFDELHQLSTRLMMMDLIGALALLYWEARE